MSVVAIHQPTFLPWLGWWDKLVRCDVFVLLDDVQYPKTGGTWMNRVKLAVGGAPMWVTVPIERAYHGVRTVRETRIDHSAEWQTKLLGTYAANYARAPFSDATRSVLESSLNVDTPLLAELNEHAIRSIARELGLDTDKLVRQSELGVHGAGTGLLVDLCKAVDGEAYLTGDGADGYLEPGCFPAAGLELIAQNFDPPRYPQRAPDFVPGLSIVDASANIGWADARGLLG